jgi:hypothetical protein
MVDNACVNKTDLHSYILFNFCEVESGVLIMFSVRKLTMGDRRPVLLVLVTEAAIKGV